jgi:hypothetical protein
MPYHACQYHVLIGSFHAILSRHIKAGRTLCAKLTQHGPSNSAGCESNEELKLATKMNLMRKIGGMISPFSSSPTQVPGVVDNCSMDDNSPKRHDTPAVSAGPHSASSTHAPGPGHDNSSAIPNQILQPIVTTPLGISPILVSPVTAAVSNRTLKQQLPALSSPSPTKRRNSCMVQDFSTATEVLYSYSGSEGCPGKETNHTEIFCNCSYCLRVASLICFPWHLSL